MSSPTETFQEFAAAVDALHEAFPDQEEMFSAGESVDQVAFATGIANVAGLGQPLADLADILMPLGFELTLHVTADDAQAKLPVRGGPPALVVDCAAVSSVPANDDVEMSDEAVVALESFWDQVKTGATGLPLAPLRGLLDTIARGGVTVQIALQVFLNKEIVRNVLLAGIPTAQQSQLAIFLFPQAFVDALKPLSPADFEGLFCAEGRRTVILVPGLASSLEGELLVVAGRDMAGRLDGLLNQPLPGSVLEAARETLAFQAGQNVWLHPTKWLLPEFFAVTPSDGAEDPLRPAISRQLKSFQVLLAVIFLADHAEQQDEGHRVEFSGFGRVRLPLTRAELLAHEADWPALVQLYRYSYEGHSPDKLEIAQQFLSLIVEDLPSLFRKAGEVEGATKKTYEKALIDKVGAYFDARQKIQDRIASAIAEASDGVISLSRDISSDLYKVAGVLAAAVAGALLDPNITTVAALLAAIVIVIYARIVLYYHLPTLDRAYDLRMEQHTQFIESFKEILRDDEWKDYLSDKHLGLARQLFAEKYAQTRTLYQVALSGALIIVIITAVLLLVSAGASPTP